MLGCKRALALRSRFSVCTRTLSTGVPGLMDCDQVYVKPDKYGGVGAFARVDIKQGQLVEKGIVRECQVQGESPFVFTWSQNKQAPKFATGSGTSTFYNMSEDPNTHVTREFDDHSFKIHALRDIKKDEELTNVYLGATWRDCYKDLKPLAEKYLKKHNGETPEVIDGADTSRAPVEGEVPGLVDASKVLVKPDKWGGAGAFARVPIKKGEVVERGIVRVLPVDGNVEPFVFTWSEEDPRKWAHGSGASIFYNMDSNPNTHMERDFAKGTWEIHAIRDIAEGEELTHVYISSMWRTCFTDIKFLAEQYMEKQKQA